MLTPETNEPEPIEVPALWRLVDAVTHQPIKTGETRFDFCGTPLRVTGAEPPRFDSYGRVKTDRGTYHPYVLHMRWVVHTHLND